MISILNWFSVILLILTATGLLFSRNWRWNLGILAIQYLGVFWLTYAQWPFTMAVVKLLTGWTACVVLGMTQTSFAMRSTTETAWPQSRLFRVATAGLVGVVSLALAFRTSYWLGMELSVAWGSLFLMGMGLFFVGMTAQPMRITIGLLTFLAGFEILYAAVETSILVATLLAVVTLGLALAGAYLINIAPREGLE